MNRIVAWLLLFLAMALPAAGLGTPGVLTNGSSVNLPFQLPGGVTGDVTVSFESVTGLSLPDLGISVSLVSATDPALLARLPEGTAIPAGFPVLVRIEPPPLGGLAFTGVATVQIHPSGLPYAPDNPLRLVAAPLGGAFADITTALQTVPSINLDTSYRVIGSKAGFSEFLIVTDATPPDRAAAQKLDALDQILQANAGRIADPVRAELAGELAATRAHLNEGNGGDVASALQDLDFFLATAERHSGTDIPDIWRAQRDLVNVAGLLRAGAQTLQFSLRLQQQGQ
jgi:hypothetical protein